MDKKEYLKTMLTNIIHDKTAEAAINFHEYLQQKMTELINPNNIFEMAKPDFGIKKEAISKMAEKLIN
jgi:hypothetical protein